jgi:Uma2 family endonuclease
MTLSTIHPDRLHEAARVVPISVDQYDRMIDAGILPEGAPIELIDGMLVLKDRSKAGEDIMTIGSEHNWAFQVVGRTDERLRPLGCHMQSQGPVIVSSYGEPEPDGAVLIGTADDCVHDKPTAADVTSVIEVSDSSLDFDRTTKLRAYAESGIPQYLIVNLVDLVIEEHVAPDPANGRYKSSHVLRDGDMLQLFLKGDERLSVEVGHWLPPKSL